MSEVEISKTGLFARLRHGLNKTGQQLSSAISDVVLGKKEIDQSLLEELETHLLAADLGIETSSAVIAELTERVARKELTQPDALYGALKSLCTNRLKSVEQPLVIPSAPRPFVLLVVGVNGVGKTTTIGKLAHHYQQAGLSVMLAAGDTFRAAAVEQLQEWGRRHQVPVVAQHTGADSASVIFDAVQSAKAKGIDLVIADTAGRLHTRDNLMEELKKVVRVIKKCDATAPHEILLVLDAGTGQNALNQSHQFLQAVPVSGLALTKLDGTAKGGIIFALAERFRLPVRFIGVGEQAEDLQPFDAAKFVQALLPSPGEAN